MVGANLIFERLEGLISFKPFLFTYRIDEL